MAGGTGAGQRSQARPLLVLVVADQMRADHLATFAHRWKSGFRVLLDQGAYFPRAEFPYLNTVTCAGHTTVGTGAYPRTHGVILNGWWSPESRRYENCMDDPAAPHVTYGRPATGGSSGKRILVPTLADELRAQQPGARVVGVGLKARSTIPLAGRAGVADLVRRRGRDVRHIAPVCSSEPVNAVRDFIATDAVRAGPRQDVGAARSRGHVPLPRRRGSANGRPPGGPRSSRIR